MKTNLGGDRIGSGNKIEVETSEFGKSTHDLSFIWRSTMSFGTCVPFLNIIGLPGDEFEIDLEALGQTGPTNGPAFAGAKQQYDIFTADLRLYNALAHNNPVDIGLNMSKIKLHQYKMNYDTWEPRTEWLEGDTFDNYFTEPSSLLRYLGINGIGQFREDDEQIDTYRLFNGTSIIAYYDIMKNYYANKMEEDCYVIHKGSVNIDVDIWTTRMGDVVQKHELMQQIDLGSTLNANLLNQIFFDRLAGTGAINTDNIILQGSWEEISGVDNIVHPILEQPLTQLIASGMFVPSVTNAWDFVTPVSSEKFAGGYIQIISISVEDGPISNALELFRFPLKNFDNMRNRILKEVDNPNPLIINELGIAPYNLFEPKVSGVYARPRMFTQEGLFLKTYQSDIFNNWVNSDIIVGENGVNELSALNIDNDKLYISDLIISNKLFELFNDIAVAGNNLSGWINAVWGKEYYRDYEIPVYQGGMSQNLVFEEVVSNSAAGIENVKQPLGTLAGRGVSNGKKNGKVKIKVNQPCIIMGIVSVTPYIDYAQGNDWLTGLKTWDDFHKPKLDQIGFQDLIGDKMHWGSTKLGQVEGSLDYQSVGKQPAWLDYQTNYNKVFGNFSKKNNQQWMVFNRDYQRNENGEFDFTTYIDPVKFNNIFAYTELDAQNIWQQIKVDIKAKRVMSYKIMPKL